MKLFCTEIAPTSGMQVKLADLFSPSHLNSLEQSFKKLLGVSGIEITCSGTAALIVILTLLKQRSNRKYVLIPAFSCPLVPLAIAKAGLKVKLCDIQPNHPDFCFEKLEELCNEDTLCIMPTHLAGIPSNLERVSQIAKQVGAAVIEDGAQAFGAKSKGAPVGTIGDFGFFSLAAGKGLTMFEGGVLLSKNTALFADLKGVLAKIINRTFVFEIMRCLQLLGYAALYNKFGLRFVYGNKLRKCLRAGDDIGAASEHFCTDIPIHSVSAFRKNIAAAQFVRFESHIQENQSRARERLPLLRELKSCSVIEPDLEDQATFPYYLLCFHDAKISRNALDRLWGAGLGVAKPFARALIDYEYLKDIVPRIDAPNARSFAERTISISNSAMMKEKEFEKVLKILQLF